MPNHTGRFSRKNVSKVKTKRAAKNSVRFKRPKRRKMK